MERKSTLLYRALRQKGLAPSLREPALSVRPALSASAIYRRLTPVSPSSFRKRQGILAGALERRNSVVRRPALLAPPVVSDPAPRRRRTQPIILAPRTGTLQAILRSQFLSGSPRRPSSRLALLLAVTLLLPSLLFAQEAPLFTNHFSGYFKTIAFFTQTSGLIPESVHSPLALAEAKEDVFSLLGRLRLKLQSTLKVNDETRIKTRIDYDHQPRIGTFVDTGDYRIARDMVEGQQFLDLSQTLVEDNDGVYEHRLYRASVAYETDAFSVEVGRQQIPWGKGHFFTPTDLFNPFNPTQIELQERDGVDAVDFKTKFRELQIEFVYTPRGRKVELHPQRFLGRIADDMGAYTFGLLGGRVQKDHVVGFDVEGNIGDSAVRGEFLFRENRDEKDFVKFTLNADYNFPHNIYALLEYHFNGQGRRDPDAYQLDRLLSGEIQQLGKNYLGLSLGHDLTPLLRFEHRMIMNLDDVSFFLRPEIQYEIRSDLMFTLAAQLFLGANVDEYGRPKNLFLGELNYSF